MSPTKPVHEVRLGLIKVVIWRANTRAGDRHNVSVYRLFKNGDAWTQSQRFGRDDILLLTKALDIAHSWIYQHNQAEGVAETQGETS